MPTRSTTGERAARVKRAPLTLSIDLSTLPDNGYVDKLFLLDFLRLSSSGFEYRIRNGLFPPGFKFGKRRFWSTAFLRHYLEELDAAQRNA